MYTQDLLFLISLEFRFVQLVNGGLISQPCCFFTLGFIGTSIGVGLSDLGNPDLSYCPIS